MLEEVSPALGDTLSGGYRGAPAKMALHGGQTPAQGSQRQARGGGAAGSRRYFCCLVCWGGGGRGSWRLPGWKFLGTPPLGLLPAHTSARPPACPPAGSCELSVLEVQVLARHCSEKSADPEAPESPSGTGFLPRRSSPISRHPLSDLSRRLSPGPLALPNPQNSAMQVS